MKALNHAQVLWLREEGTSWGVWAAVHAEVSSNMTSVRRYTYPCALEHMHTQIITQARAHTQTRTRTCTSTGTHTNARAPTHKRRCGATLQASAARYVRRGCDDW